MSQFPRLGGRGDALGEGYGGTKSVEAPAAATLQLAIAPEAFGQDRLRQPPLTAIGDEEGFTAALGGDLGDRRAELGWVRGHVHAGVQGG